MIPRSSFGSENWISEISGGAKQKANINFNNEKLTFKNNNANLFYTVNENLMFNTGDNNEGYKYLR